MKKKSLSQVILAASILVLAALACGPAPEGKTISVAINSPGSGDKVVLGEEVSIDSTAVGDVGVDRVELSVNGAVVSRDLPPSGNPPTFRVVQSWTPTAEGLVTVSVAAFDVNGTSSPPATIMLNVVNGDAVAPTSESGAEDAPLPPVTTEGGCTLGSQYMADVTIPDETVISPGETFIKTWRVRNTGTCDWEAGYELVFLNGAQMSGPESATLPSTPAGVETDVSVNLTAPSTYGTHKGTWAIQAADGATFGDNLTVVIVVPSPATDTPEPPPPTDTPEPTEETLGPDLIVSHLTVTPNSGKVPFPITVEVRVMNAGDEPSGDFHVQWIGVGAVCVWPASSLDPGEEHSLDCSTSITKAAVGTAPTLAMVDFQNEVNETDEGNNARAFPLMLLD